jgi:two-component system NarL family response regulator
LKRSGHLQVVAEASTGEEAVANVLEVRPDLVLLDLNLPGMGGVETCRALKEKCPDLRVVILTMSDELDSIFEAVRAGACGYLLKDIASQNLLEAIDQIDREGGILEPFLARRLLAAFSGGRAPTREEGRSPEVLPGPAPVLSPRELEILRKVVDGLSNKEIADQLMISKYTVGNHINNIFRKLGVNDRTQAAVTALKHRMV